MADLSNIKSLMGDAFHDDVSVEEIESFLSKGKFIDLKTGDYVSKEKFTRIEDELKTAKQQLNELQDSTKDYETLKQENESLKGEKADAELSKQLTKYGISEKALKYVKGDIADKTLTLTDDEKANESAVKEYLQSNPQFASNNTKGTNVIGSIIRNADDSKTDTKTDNNQKINDAFRDLVGVNK